MRPSKRLAIAALISGVVFGQSTGSQPKFVVADVQPSVTGSNNLHYMEGGFYMGGRYQIRYASMIQLITAAYGFDPDMILGGPGWLDFDNFDVMALAPPDSTMETLRAMMQNLLADRFKLVVHLDKKELPTYALTAGKRPLLTEADGSEQTGCALDIQGLNNSAAGPPLPDAPRPAPVFHYKCGNMTMAAFADAIHTMAMAQQYVGSNPILDDTGIKGAWNFEFHYSVPAGTMGQGSAGGLSMLDAVDKQLGLKLEPRKVPLPVLVVDSAVEKPTPNPPDLAAKLPALPTEFDVADIKPTDPKNPQRQSGGYQPGRLDVRGITLKQLIVMAWDTTPGMIMGGPKFIDEDRFDILAKAPAETTTKYFTGLSGHRNMDTDALNLMLRGLLIDRFHLKVHTEDRLMPAYTLVAAKPKLKPADPARRTRWSPGPDPGARDPRKDTPALNNLVTCHNMTMAQLAVVLPNFASDYFQNVSRTVVDATGLDGAYDFTLNFSYAATLNGNFGGNAVPQPGAAGGMAQAAEPSGGMSLMDAMEKQLGIKMEVQKRPAPVLVIDYIDQKPTAN